MAYGYYAGDLDDVRMTDQPLSAADVVALAAGLEGAEARYYCETAYEAVLNRLGTSYENPSGTGAELEERESLAARLGISLECCTVPVQPEKTPSSCAPIRSPRASSSRFADWSIPDVIHCSRPPPTAHLALESLRAMWLQRTMSRQHGCYTSPLIIDPDMMGQSDLRTPMKICKPYDLWEERRNWLQKAITDLQGSAPAAPAAEEALNALVNMVFLGTTGPDNDFWKLADDQQKGTDIRPKLAELHLTSGMFRRLVRVRALAREKLPLSPTTTGRT